MERFRVKLKNGRVLGPFSVNQFIELFQKGHIDGTEEFQVFPVGDWKKLQQFPEINNLLEESNSFQQDATFIRKISDLKNENADTNDLNNNSNLSDFPNEFSYELENEDESLDINNDHINEDSIEENDHGINSTKVNNNSNLSEDFEKTVVSLDTKKYLEQLKKEEEIKKLQETEEKNKKINDDPSIDYENDSTQMIDLNLLKNELKKKSTLNEKVLKSEEKLEIKKIKELEKLKLKKTKIDNSDDEEDEEQDIKKKRVILLIIILAFVFIFYPKEEKKKKIIIKPIYSSVEFPQRYETPNTEIAEKNYIEGMKLYNQHSYVTLLKSRKFFKNAVENEYKNTKYMAKLISVYSKLIQDSKDKLNIANKTFKLVQINMTQVYKDPALATAVTLFYMNNGKLNAAKSIVEKFNLIKQNKPTLELFAVYLDVLVKLGDFVRAKAVYNKLSAVEKRSYDVNVSLINYNLKTSKYDDASKILQNVLKIYPDNVKLLLLQSQLSVLNDNYAQLNYYLNIILNKHAEYSPTFYSKYLEYKGMIAILKQDVKGATSLFKKALSINESPELRSRLAMLDLGNNDDVNNLINESKAMNEIFKAKLHLKNKNWKFAFLAAIEAVNIAPHFIEAKLFLSDLQIRLNYFEEAISTLDNLYKSYPSNKEILFSLTNAYIQSFKHNIAKKFLSIIAVSEFRSEPQYFKLTANYYLKNNNFQQAVTWLQKAINSNPLDDELVFSLAKLFMQYNKFDQGKILLTKAIELDPSNVDYRIAYANIIYEVDGVSPSIGYLYDLLVDFPDNPKIYSSVGIYYYKSGQLKLFNQVKDKLLSLPKIDETLYDFLIKSAKLDDKIDDVIKYCKKLININPYDIETRMYLGQVYMESGNVVEALKVFKDVLKRVQTYPKLQYYMSKLYLLIDDIDQSVAFAEKEVKANPTSELGYILLGDIYQKQKKFIEAENEYKKAQRINPKNIDTLIGLASINFKKSQYEIALDLYNKAISIDPNRSESYKLIGDVYRKIGQTDLAIKSYKTFLELSPTTKYREQIDSYIKMME